MGKGSLKTYFKYALCIIRDSRLLVVKERDMELYLMPGGTPEAGESYAETLRRELKEELNIELDSGSLQHLGAFEDVAAGREDARVHIELYTGDFSGEISPCSEVERLVWFSKDDDWSKLAPVTRNKILPALSKQGLLS